MKEDYSLESRRMLSRLENSVEEQVEACHSFTRMLQQLKELIIIARESSPEDARKALAAMDRKFESLLQEAKVLIGETKKEYRYRYVMKGNSWR